MKVTKTKLDGVLVLEPEVFHDERGYFFESWNQEVFNKATGLKVEFVQDNQSCSKKGVLRGLHYQKPPYEQGKLVRVIQGEVFDVAVDIRPDSPTFKEWFGISLSAENKKQLWIPEGFAHGFISLSSDVIFLYKCTVGYSPEAEERIPWNDSTIKVEWPLVGEGTVLTSQNDAINPKRS